MYRYDSIDQTLVDERVVQFRDQTRRFLSGALTEDEFKPLRLRNGLYIQRFAPMLRVAVPYGLLSSRQVRMLAHIARTYDRGYGHFTTRQNIQYNWPKLEQVPDILAELASVEMHAMQTSGNCIRNITADHLAGVAADEIADPRPYCEIIRQWATLHPEFSYLPRKFKIAVTASPADRAASEVHDVGVPEFRRQVEAEFESNSEFAPRLSEADVARMRAFFEPPPYERLDELADAGGAGALPAAAYQAWYRYNTRAHRVRGYRIVFVSLKKHGEAPGDITDAQLEALADLADRYSFGLIRATHDQNLVLADVPQRALRELWQALEALGLATPNIGTLTDMICCPGLDFCSLANAGSIPIAKQIHARFDDLDYLYDLGPIEIKMSGCMNACGHHHIGHIGILGVDKHGKEWYQITIGGSSAAPAALGEVIGPSVPKEAVADTIAKLLDVYLDARQDEHERFIDTVRRIGVEPFQERVYETDYSAA
jgi:sulfite reductase beta subunit-like hemoprotein